MPYLPNASSTWAASSRVGSRISVRGMRARARPFSSIDSIGSVKAAVLPVPVWAMPSTSRPLQGVGNGLFLDRRRRVVAGRFDGVEHFLAQAEFIKFHSLSLVKRVFLALGAPVHVRRIRLLFARPRVLPPRGRQGIFSDSRCALL